jgi:hypothetical protein
MGPRDQRNRLRQQSRMNRTVRARSRGRTVSGGSIGNIIGSPVVLFRETRLHDCHGSRRLRPVRHRSNTDGTIVLSCTNRASPQMRAVGRDN